MKYAFENWHLLMIVVVLFFVFKAGTFGFMGSLSGICTSHEPITKAEVLSGMSGWSLESVNGSVSADGLTWSSEYLTVIDVSSVPNMTCSAYINGLVNTAFAQENASSKTFFEGTKKVVELNNLVVEETVYDTLLLWCGGSPDLVLQSNSVLAKDLYFTNFYTCVDCVAGNEENKTCSDESVIEWRTCTEGFWEVQNTCPVSVSTADGGGKLSGGTVSVGVECLPTEYYDKVQRSCKLVEVATPEQEMVEEAPVKSKLNLWLIGAVIVIAGFALYIFKKKK